jgi:hypothetical protein
MAPKLQQVTLDVRKDGERLTHQSEGEANRLLNEGNIDRALAILENSYQNLSVFSSNELRLRVTYDYARALKQSATNLGLDNVRKARDLYKSLEESYDHKDERVLGVFESSFSKAARRAGLTRGKIKQALLDLDVYEAKLTYDEFVDGLSAGTHPYAYRRFRAALEVIRRDPAMIIAGTGITYERAKSDLNYLELRLSAVLESLAGSADRITLKPEEREQDSDLRLRPWCSGRPTSCRDTDIEIEKAYWRLQMQHRFGIRFASSKEDQIRQNIFTRIERCRDEPEVCAKELVPVDIVDVAEAVRATLRTSLGETRRQVDFAFREIEFMRPYGSAAEGD